MSIWIIYLIIYLICFISDSKYVNTYSSATVSDVGTYTYINVTDAAMTIWEGQAFGIYYTSQPLVGLYPMSCSYTDSNGTSHTAPYVKYLSATSLTVGTTYTFTDYTTSCVDYMVEAIVNYLRKSKYYYILPTYISFIYFIRTTMYLGHLID